MSSNDLNNDHRKPSRLAFFIATAVTFGIAFMVASPSNADVTVYESEDKAQSFKVGAALKGGVDFDVTKGHDLDPEFTLNNARIYTKAQVLEDVGFSVVAEYRQGDGFNLLDGFVYAKVNDQLQLRAGQTKAPFDRATLSSAFNRLTWNSSIISKYPAVYNKRNRGGALWGTFAIPVSEIDAGVLGTIKPSLKYQAGVFEGIEGVKDIGDLLYAGRVQLNLLDGENEYTEAGNYFGTKNVLAIGTSLAFQNDALGVNKDDNYLAWSADVLFDSNIGTIPGNFTLAAAVNLYDLDNAPYVPGDGLNEGVGFSVEGAYLIPFEVPAGPLSGKIQPFVRYQQFEFDGFVDNGNEKQIDAGLNYVLAKNALVTVSYSHNELLGVKSDGVNAGIRFKF